MWDARLAQHYRHSTGVVAFGRFVQGCSSRSEAHVAGQDLTTLLGRCTSVRTLRRCSRRIAVTEREQKISQF